jgi:hypothetical protein
VAGYSYRQLQANFFRRRLIYLSGCFGGCESGPAVGGRSRRWSHGRLERSLSIAAAPAATQLVQSPTSPLWFRPTWKPDDLGEGLVGPGLLPVAGAGSYGAQLSNSCCPRDSTEALFGSGYAGLGSNNLVRQSPRRQWRWRYRASSTRRSGVAASSKDLKSLRCRSKGAGRAPGRWRQSWRHGSPQVAIARLPGADHSPSQQQEMAFPRPKGRGRGHRTIERDEPASSLHSKSEEVDIGHLAWSVNAARVDTSPVQEAHG